MKKSDSDNLEKVIEKVHSDKSGYKKAGVLESLLTSGLELSNNSNSNQQINKLEVYADIIDKLLSEKYIDQKSILNREQIIGLIELCTYNVYLEKNFGFVDDIAEAFIKETIIKMINLDGAGRKSIIEFVKGIKDSIDDEIKAKGLYSNLNAIKTIN